MFPPVPLNTGGSSSQWPGGRGLLQLTGTFTSVQLKAGATGSGSTPNSIGTAATVAGSYPFNLPPCSIAVTIVGGSGETATAVPLTEY